MEKSEPVLARLRLEVARWRETAIDLQRDLTAIPALGPQNGGTGEWDKAMKLAEWLPKLGLPAAVNHPAPDNRVPGGKRPNLVVTIPGRSTDRTFWIMTHLDIVPPGEPSMWTGDPYRMRLDGDRLIGRGVEDNQQSLVASMVAAAAVRALGIEPAVTTRLLFVADEETGSAYGVGHLLAATTLFRPADLALGPDSGSSDGAQVEIAEKSILWLRFTTRGRQCHASTPQKGINAFVAGSNLVVRLAELASAYPAVDPLFDPPVSTFTPTKKEPNVPNVNTLPGEDAFHLDCRVLPRENLDEVMTKIRAITDGVERDFGVTVGIETVQRASSPPTPADAPIIAALGRAIRAVYAVEPRIVGIGGGTVGAFLRRAGISTAVWSRVDETAHQPDESSRIGNLLGDALVMAALMVGGEAGA